MKRYALTIVAVLIPYFSAEATPTLIQGVPAYAWYHGCEPTSIGMILGYWDIKGYSNLFTAEGTAVLSTANVQDQISSPEHNAKYDPMPDNSSLPVPEKTSIADYLKTSVDRLGFDPTPIGGSSAVNSGTATVEYATYKGYAFTATTLLYSAISETFVNEINAGRPMLFFVDSDGNGVFDHAVPVFGYDSNYNGDGLYYACYTTGSENETPVWEKFQHYENGKLYGVYGGVAINPGPIPKLTLSNVGIKQNKFGFTVTGPKSMIVTIEASTDLNSWATIETPILDSTSGTFIFADSNWTSHIKRFYRVHWP
jgi:hypothetical protein